MTDVILRVRPGFTHGAQDRYQAGDTFAAPDGEAALLLAAFGDKLEVVAEPESPTLAVSNETPGVADKPARKRKAEGS